MLNLELLSPPRMGQTNLWGEENLSTPEEPSSGPPPYISFSQVSTYSTCGERYRLKYIVQAPQEPSGPAIAGTAVHETIAEAEKEGWWDVEEQPALEMVASFRRSLDRQIEEAGGLDLIRWGGRKTRDYPQGENLHWWQYMGPVMLKRYAAIRKADTENGIFIFTKDVETRVSAFLPHPDKPITDAIHVVGYIDAIVMVDKDGTAIIRDWKTGNWAEPQQLAVYSWLLANREPPLHAMIGEIAKLRSPDKNKWITRYDLGKWVDLVPRLVLDSAQGIGAGYFPLKPSHLCPSCSVRASCPWGKTLG